MVVLRSIILVMTPPMRLDAQGQRGDVEQQDALHVAGQHAALDGRAHGHDLVGVDGHVRLLAGELLDHLLHGGHTGGTAHEDDLVDVAGRRPASLSAC